MSGCAHSSGGLLHGDNHRIPSAISTFFSQTNVRELSGFCLRKFKLHGAHVQRFAAALKAQLMHFTYVILQMSELPLENSFELN